MHVTRHLLTGALALAMGVAGGVAGGAEAPRRIVSLDYCADQFVLKFAPPGAVAAVSPDAGADYSYMRAAAAGVPTVRPRAEDVLALRPDLVVQSYGGGAGAAAQLARAGVPVLPIGFARSIKDVRANVLRLSAALGAEQAGRATVADMDARLTKAARPDSGVTALYLTTGGWTSGHDTLVGDLMEAAGLSNLENRSGWRPLPLERLARQDPDLIATAFFGSDTQGRGNWASSTHPVTLRMLAITPTVTLDGAWTSCGGWFLVDAVEALAAARDRILPERAPK
jgi:iron complex transport system substrate-binding protein